MILLPVKCSNDKSTQHGTQNWRRQKENWQWVHCYLPNNAARSWKLPEPSHHDGTERVKAEKQKTCPHHRTAYLPSSLISFHALITIATRKQFPVSSGPAIGSTVCGGISLGGKGILQKDEKQLPGKGAKR